MNTGNKNELPELLEKLFGRDHAHHLLQDIKQGEKILRENPAPEPRKQLTDRIKAQITQRLAQRKALAKRRRWALKLASIAATLLIAAAVTINFLAPTTDQTDSPTAATVSVNLWRTQDIAEAEEHLAALSAEAEQIRRDLHTLEFGNGTTDTADELVEMQTQLVELESQFWKG